MSVKERIANEIQKSANTKNITLENIVFTANEQTPEDLAQKMKGITAEDVMEYSTFRRQISINVLIDEVEEIKARLAKLEK